MAPFVAARALLGRPLSRRALDVAIALLFSAYLAINGGLFILGSTFDRTAWKYTVRIATLRSMRVTSR
jgi:hypothetical protein